MTRARAVGRAVMGRLRQHGTGLLGVVGLAAAAMPFLVTQSFLFDLTLVFIFGMLAFAAIVPIGYAGQLILAQGAFFGVGAYTYVLLTLRGVPGILAVVLATVLTAAVAYALGRVATRAQGIYLGIITLAFNELFVIGLELFPDLTGGSVGLNSPELFPGAVAGTVPPSLLRYYLVLLVYLGVLVASVRILGSETGSAFLAVKEDITLAESIGIDSQATRRYTFLLSGVVCGIAGTLYAPANGFISPPLFDLQTTIDIILAGVAGGLTAPVGSIFGAVIVVLVPEFLRPIAEFRLMLYGVLLIVLLAYLPQGIGGWLVERWRES